LNQYIVVRLEDAVKQTDFLVELYALRGLAGGEKNFGLVNAQSNLTRHGSYTGCRIQVKGTLDGSRRTTVDGFDMGAPSFSTRSTVVSYSHLPAKTSTGTRGVKVMFFY
jgi:hypothetical protein